jgi:7-cyano-7-deazaguanine reductase
MNKQAEATHLGKVSKYPQQYDTNVLVRVPRIENRVQYNIPENKHTPLPFVGYDTWNAYEVSFLTEKGLPVTGVLKIVYPCDNKFIVESKSLKLYLNSFNMSMFGQTKGEGINIVTRMIKEDLSSFLETHVRVHWFTDAHLTFQESIFDGYLSIEDEVDMDTLRFREFKEAPHIIKVEPTNELHIVKIKCDLLRSNCKVTHQPDWGTLFLYANSYSRLDLRSLAYYIVSFRNENHFHEEVVEMIYKRLYEKIQPEDLMVAAVYTRRGGIDICPSRATSSDLLDNNLITPTALCIKRFRQ